MAAARTPSGATATALGSAPGASARPRRSVRAAFGSYAHGWRSPVGGTWIPSTTRPSGRKSADVIVAPGSGGRTIRTSGSARQRVTSALGALTATKATRRTLTGRERSGPNGPKTRVSERCIAAPDWAEVLERSIRTDRDTARGHTGHVVGTQRTGAREPVDTTSCPGEPTGHEVVLCH